MLKNVPSIISPELLKILMEMGHGDTIVIGDGNFPAAANAKRLVRLDGHGVPEILDAILKLMPLDTYVKTPVSLMDNGDKENRPPIWDEYKKIIEKNDNQKAEPKAVRRSSLLFLLAYKNRDITGSCPE